MIKKRSAPGPAPSSAIDNVAQLAGTEVHDDVLEFSAAIALLIMMLGMPVPFLGVGLLGGVWVALIGWFLSRAAMMSYAQLVAGRTLEQVPVSRFMLAPVDAAMRRAVYPGTRARPRA